MHSTNVCHPSLYYKHPRLSDSRLCVRRVKSAPRTGSEVFHDTWLASAGRGGKGGAFSSRPLPYRPNLWRSCRPLRERLRVLAVAVAKGAEIAFAPLPVREKKFLRSSRSFPPPRP